MRAGRHLAKVFYYLEVRQAGPGPAPAADAAGQTAAWDITGEVTVSQDEPMQAQVNSSLRSGEVFTLVLADGRRLEVRASQGDPLKSTTSPRRRGRLQRPHAAPFTPMTSSPSPLLKCLARAGYGGTSVYPP